MNKMDEYYTIATTFLKIGLFLAVLAIIIYVIGLIFVLKYNNAVEQNMNRINKEYHIHVSSLGAVSFDIKCKVNKLSDK